jgi:hypothetical protein
MVRLLVEEEGTHGRSDQLAGIATAGDDCMDDAASRLRRSSFAICPLCRTTAAGAGNSCLNSCWRTACGTNTRRYSLHALVDCETGTHFDSRWQLYLPSWEGTLSGCCIDYQVDLAPHPQYKQ